MDPGVTSAQNSRRRVPIHFRDGLKAKLDDMEIHGVITKVTELSKSISNMVVVRTSNKKKNGYAWTQCPLNKEIKRNHYPICTTEKTEENQGLFTVDAKDGFL